MRKLPWPRTVQERNIYLLYGEVVMAAVLSAATAFNATYILRLGGSRTLIGLLSSIPALVAIFLFLPAARILEKQRRYAPFVVWSLFASRIGYLLLALIPFLMRERVPEVSIGILIAMSVPSVLFTTGWNPLLADVVPKDLRARVFSWRNILSSGTFALLTFIAGLLLDRGTFPSNFQWLYVVGLVGGLLSVYLVARIDIPSPDPARVPLLHDKVSWWRGIREGLDESPGFGRLMVNTLFFSLGAWMLGPLYIIFFVQELGALDSWVGLYTTLIHIGVVVGYWAWRHISLRIGDFPGLLMALPVTASFPFLVALFPNLTVILVVGFIIHLFQSGVNLNHSLLFVARVPPSRRHTGIAFYSTVMNLGAFISPMLGVALADLIGIRMTLVLGGILRMIGVYRFYHFPLDERRLDLATMRKALGWLNPLWD